MFWFIRVIFYILVIIFAIYGIYMMLYRSFSLKQLTYKIEDELSATTTDQRIQSVNAKFREIKSKLWNSFNYEDDDLIFPDTTTFSMSKKIDVEEGKVSSIKEDDMVDEEELSDEEDIDEEESEEEFDDEEYVEEDEEAAEDESDEEELSEEEYIDEEESEEE